MLVINAVGTHDWINPLASHRAFFKDTPLDLVTVQRINCNHGVPVDMAPDEAWTATELVQMRAMLNLRNPADPDAFPLHSVRWVSLDDSGPNWVATIEIDSRGAAAPAGEEYAIHVAASDDRDFRRMEEPVKSKINTPCIDSDPHLDPDMDKEDYFHRVEPISVVVSGNRRILTFTPPSEIASISNPLVAVIVEALFPGADTGASVDDVMVTTWPEFLNEESYPSSVSVCQGMDEVNVLRVNEKTGVGTQGSVVVDAGGPIEFRITKPDAGGLGKFVVHLDIGSPTIHTVTRINGQLGSTCFPFLVSQWDPDPLKQPRAIFNSIGKEHLVGESMYFDGGGADPAPAPTTFLKLPSGDPANLEVGTVFTLQGVITNPDVIGPKKVSITNAIVVTVM